MKHANLRYLATTLLSICAALGGCGGSSSDGQPLSIEDGAPAAYTVDYLNAHPNLLVQPEHLIIVTLDPTKASGTRQSVRLHIREPMTLSLNLPTSGAASEVLIEDSAGSVQLEATPGAASVSATLEQGDYEILFQASPTLDAPQTLFLKLADTPTQATLRQQVGTLLAGAPGGVAVAGASPTPLGEASSNTCFNCDFDGADLSNQNFTDSFLGGSTFRQTTLTNTNFTRAYCYQCVFQNLGPPGALNFTDAILDSTTLCCDFEGVSFSGAMINGSTLKGDFVGANFGPSSTRSTTLRGSNLAGAVMFRSNIRYADFTGAAMQGDKLLYDQVMPAPTDYVGVIFDNVTPSKFFSLSNFAGFDLTGASFAGIDMSGADLSVASGTKITPAGVSKAILTNGTTGANLSGQNFGTGFVGWAGSADGTTPGADLRGVNLAGANLFQADLTGVNLSGATLIGADMSNTSLKRAKLVGAQLGVTPDSGTGTAANLSGAYMPLADLTDADLRSVKFDNAHVYGAVKFVRARLDSASMIGANLAGADFTQASLANTNLTMAVLVGANFSGAGLQNTSMYKAYVQGASFTDTLSVAGLSLFDAYVSPGSGSWSFQEADGTPFVIGYDATVLGDLSTTDKGVAECPSGEQGPCTGSKLLPSPGVPYPPPPPQCIPAPPDYDNCLPS